MKFYIIFLSCALCIISNNKTVSAVEYQDNSDVGIPDDVFSGIYCGAGIGYDLLDHKYELISEDINLFNNIGNKKHTIHANACNVYGIFGGGAVYNRVYYVGVESELFYRVYGSQKSHQGVRVSSKKTYGFNFKLRGGYIFRPAGVLAYLAGAAERSVHHISVLNNNNQYVSEQSFGSYHPVVSIGLEKKLRNKWSVRAELSYLIGIWDDTNKNLNVNNRNVPFKAKANKKTVKLMICKFL